MSSSSSSNSKRTPYIKESEHLRIPFQDIKEATKDFTTLIGKGGYGWVYKGELLLSGILTCVAVKRLDCSNISGQGLKEFLTEIHLLTRYKHPNLVSLLGFCEEHGENILVYDYAEYGSLDKYLTAGKSPPPPLTWMQRINICIDAARGLDYLHNHVAQDHRVIHRDIKSANVLLGQGWKAMIADFGLSKIGRANENVTFLITNASGTHGYCDPAYMDTGILTKESDVYSFGVVLFEVLCGRLGFINVNSEQRFLAPLAKRYYDKGRLSEIIDPYLKIEVHSDSLNRFSEIAYQCLLNDRQQRPSMGLVVQKLEEIRYNQMGSTDPKTFVFEDVSKHNKTKDCWLIIDGKVYDVTPFMEDHPGGDEVLLAATGKDATEDFEDVGHSESARDMMHKYYIGEADMATVPKKRTYVAPTDRIYNPDKTRDFIV